MYPIGYACMNMSIPDCSVNRTMRKATFQEKGLQGISEKALANIVDLEKIVHWTVEHRIGMYRMSSDMFPWMSEYEFADLPDYDKIKSKLESIGQHALDNGLRLSFHPGQFCVLASKSEKVVLNAIKELDKTSEIMDMMLQPRSHQAKINIHVGGVYGDKDSAMQRFCDNFKRLSEGTQSRLTVENDDKRSMYTVQDLYNGIHKVVGIPIVFDFHHHFCMTLAGGDTMSEEDALTLALSTWPKDIVPTVHYSESKRLHESNDKIKWQAHSDYVEQLPSTYGHQFAIMVESKAKDLAIIPHLGSKYFDIKKQQILLQ